MAVNVRVDQLDGSYCKNYATPTKALDMVNKAIAAKFGPHPDINLSLDVHIHAQAEAKGIRYYPVIRIVRADEFAMYMHPVMSMGFRITN